MTQRDLSIFFKPGQVSGINLAMGNFFSHTPILSTAPQTPRTIAEEIVKRRAEEAARLAEEAVRFSKYEVSCYEHILQVWVERITDLNNWLSPSESIHSSVLRPVENCGDNFPFHLRRQLAIESFPLNTDKDKCVMKYFDSYSSSLTGCYVLSIHQAVKKTMMEPLRVRGFVVDICEEDCTVCVSLPKLMDADD